MRPRLAHEPLGQLRAEPPGDDASGRPLACRVLVPPSLASRLLGLLITDGLPKAPAPETGGRFSRNAGRQLGGSALLLRRGSAQSSVGDAVENRDGKVRSRHLALTAVAATENRPTGIAAFAGSADTRQAVTDRQSEAALAGEALQQAAVRRAPCPRTEFRPQKRWFERDRKIGFAGTPCELQTEARHCSRVCSHNIRFAKIGDRQAGAVKQMRHALACPATRLNIGRVR